MALTEAEELELLELEEAEYQASKSRPSVVPSAPKEPGMLSKMAQRAGQALDIYGRSQFGSPQDLLGRADQLVRSGANKAGEFVAEEAGRAGMNPYAAAGIGTAMQMTPDLVETAAMPNASIGSPKVLRPVARPMAQRALGLTKRFLNTPFARGKAAQAADVALDQKVLPFGGSPKIAMERAVDLQEKSGQALGSMREAAGRNPIDPVFDSLEAARQRATGGMRGGAWETVHKKFDEAQETLMGLLSDGPDVPLAKVEQAKKLLSKTVNWIADNVSQETAKQISGSIEAGVESIMRSKGIDMTAYAAQKGLYGASKTMQKGLANEVAAQAGNNAVSLPTMVAGAGQLATGNVSGAMGTVGILEALRRRGAGAGARIIDFAGSQLPSKRLLKLPIAVGNRFSGESSPKSILKSRNHVEKPSNTSNGIPDPGNRYVGQPNNQGNEQRNQNNNNGNLKGKDNQDTSKRLLKPRQEKILTDAEAKNYLKRAKGDRAMARRMAISDGWTIPE